MEVLQRLGSDGIMVCTHLPCCLQWCCTGGSRGPPLPPRFVSKSCNFEAICREKPLCWAHFRLRPPLGVKTPLGAMTKILDPRLLMLSNWLYLASNTKRRHLDLQLNLHAQPWRGFYPSRHISRPFLPALLCTVMLLTWKGPCFAGSMPPLPNVQYIAEDLHFLWRSNSWT